MIVSFYHYPKDYQKSFSSSLYKEKINPVCTLTYILAIYLILPYAFLLIDINTAKILRGGASLSCIYIYFWIEVGPVDLKSAAFGVHHSLANLILTFWIHCILSREFELFLLSSSRVWEASTVGFLKHGVVLQ